MRVAPVAGSVPVEISTVIRLPPPPSVDVTYPGTTDYFWGTIEQNTTAVPAGGSFSTGGGPFGFLTSVILPGDSCMAHKGFAKPGDTCVSDPATCEEGLSFSLWEKTIYVEDVFADRESLQLRYLLSTGGDIKGSPGIAVYLQGMYLGALVSTGSKYWLVETVGLLPNNTWNNIGIRWRPPSTDGGEVGCHKASGDADYRHFCPCEFDEIAMWKRALLANESMFFLGGFEANFSKVSAAEFADMLVDVDLTDPDQQSVAVTLVKKMADAPEEETKDELGLGSPSTAESEQETEEEEEEEEPEGTTSPAQSASGGAPAASKSEIQQMQVLAGMVFTMTESENIKPNQTKEELDSFLNLLSLASKLLEEENAAKWNGIEMKNDRKKPDPKNPKKKIVRDREAVDMVNRLEEWAMESVANVVSDNSSDTDLLVHKRTDNVDLYVQQNSLDAFRRRQVALFPSDQVRRLDSIEVPTVVFRKPGCDEATISTVFTKYDSYGAVSPKRFMRRQFKTRQAQYLDIDSAVLSLRVKTLRGQAEVDECLPTIDDFRSSPVRATLGHKQPKQTLRQPLFHEDEIVSDVLRRHCVWWNEGSMRGLGAWDPTGCVVLESDDFFTKCACKALGQYAVVAEKVEPKIVDIDNTWLILIKTVFHTISIALLLVYAVLVFKSDQLWEMFHQMRMTTALLLLAGAFFMCMSDLDSVRADRHHCTTIAAFLQLCYLAVGVMVACEGYACFRALTVGVVGGKLRSYLCISFGVSLISLGYALATESHRYGDDPQCMMGWETDVKLIFFSPMMLCLVFIALSVVLIMCNMGTPQLRKENIIVDQESVCIGYNFFSFYFMATWVAGLLAYVRLDAEGLPSFYPLFQFMNAACGMVFFICQGMLSRRFRMIITCRGHERRRMLVAYTVHEDESDVTESRETSDDESDSQDDGESDVSDCGPESGRAGSPAAPDSQPKPEALSQLRDEQQPEPDAHPEPEPEPEQEAQPFATSGQ
ncbi:uncharacterized protein LOC119097315 [Pollicipes pollicipes]|uniref:uncharacterized protein LOC119097315 n=1 Tax=Pollicipes pollicipes TaxID=41117 RepID=UPI0018857992|nr:uncharacterized protein LOC119097315 [Pollicipes pollicipes]